LNTGAIVHHLRALERAGSVTSRREGAYRRFYVTGAPESRPAPTTTFQVVPLTPAQQRVVEALAGGPLTQADLAERLGLSQQGVGHHVKALERAGHVQAEYDGRSWRYSVVQETTVVRP
jgi:DNA-binding transcriptional ArsR family regulator